MQGLNQRKINIQDSLIDGVRKNNRKAQLQLYNMYYKAMYNTAYRILKDSAEAEDVMQEAFLTAFRKIDEYKGEASFGSWLKRIVVNRSIDDLKKRKDAISIEDLGIQITEDDTNENYLEILSFKIEEIRKGIEQLSHDDRIVISLYLLEGYDHEEIAQILDVSYNACRTRYSRAKQRLRDMLKQKRIDELVN
jgi:RNA polymerase sigma-70 factor (ECF subfamily)